MPREDENRIDGRTVNDDGDGDGWYEGMHTYLATLLSSRATILAASCCDVMMEREFAERRRRDSVLRTRGWRGCMYIGSYDVPEDVVVRRRIRENGSFVCRPRVVVFVGPRALAGPVQVSVFRYTVVTLVRWSAGPLVR